MYIDDSSNTYGKNNKFLNYIRVENIKNKKIMEMWDRKGVQDIGVVL